MNNDRKLLEQAFNLLESEWPEGDEIAQPVIDAIREVLAEPEITTPDVCGEVCARAKLCYWCGKALDEANAKLADHSGDANEMVYSKPSVFDGVCCGCSKKAADGWALYCVACWEKSNGDPFAASGKPIDHIAASGKMVAVPVAPTRAMLDAGHSDLTLEHGIDPMLKKAWSQMLDAAPVQPVKQEPVAYMFKVKRTLPSSTPLDVFAAIEYHPLPHEDIISKEPLYAAPVDAKAIRAEALEEAAKVCEAEQFEVLEDESCEPYNVGCRHCAAAIRGLK